MRDIDGQTTVFNFDSDYRLIKTTYPDNSVEKLIWGTRNFVSSTVDALGFVTKYQYDSHNNLIQIKNPSSEETFNIVYDQNFNQPTQMTSPNGAPVNLTLNQTTGDVVQVTRDGLSLQYQYDQFGNVLTTNNGIGTYSNETNSNGLYKKIFDSRNPETLSYDVRGRITNRQFQSGRIITYSYDNYDRVVLMTDNSGPSVKYTYDVLGRVLQQEIFSSTNKEVTKYLWDERSRLIQTVDNLGRKTQYQYNASNSTLYVIDKPSAIVAPDGKTTVFRYDIMQRLVQKIEADGSVTKFDYNLRGDLAKLTDAEGNYTTFTYDGNRRLVRKDAPTLITDIKGVSTPSREITLYFYDDSDRLLQEERQLNSPGAKKTVTNFVYDNLDRVIEKTVQKLTAGDDVEDSKTSTFTYESILEKNLLKTANNEVASLTFNHESLPPYKLTNAKTAATAQGNPLGLTESDLIMSYDFTNELALIKSINGTILLSSQHDIAGRLINIRSGNFLSSNGPALESTIAYDDFGRKSSITNSDGLKQVLAYDQLSRLNSMAWTRNNISDVTQKLTYDPAGNIINSKRENTETAFGYDKVNQLISEHSQVQTREFQYDKVGNRIKDSYLGNAKYISNAIVGDVKATNSFNTYGYDIDGLGNLTTIVSEKDKTQKDLTYGLNGKLETFQYSLGTNGDSLLATYYYDALDRRIAKNVQIAQGQTQKNFTQTYSYLGDEERILFAKNGNGNFTLFVDGQGIDEHIGEVTSTTAKSYVTDHLGSVLNTDASAGKKMFGAFGEKLGDTQLNALSIDEATPAVIYGYAGREYDLESGLYYNRARMYNPDMGRFVSRDPIGLAGGDVNSYRYVSNNPIRLNDPMGFKQERMDDGADPVWKDAITGEFISPTRDNYIDITPEMFLGGMLSLPAAAAAGALGVAIAPSVSSYSTAALITASNPKTIENTVDFADSLSGELGGPTSGMPPSTPGGVAGSFLGKSVKNRCGDN
jgi:RHS repeat-associated protein